MKTYIKLLVVVCCLSACSQHDDFIESFEQGGMTKAIVSNPYESQSNPDLLTNWENITEITLNSPGKRVTAPWANGSPTSLPSFFRTDIKKQMDG